MEAESKCEKAFFAKGLIFSNEKRIKTQKVKAKNCKILTNSDKCCFKFKQISVHVMIHKRGMSERTDARVFETDTTETTTIRFSKAANSAKISSHDALSVALFGCYKREFKMQKKMVDRNRVKM